jgi:RND family efflux transporter MFP subunit
MLRFAALATLALLAFPSFGPAQDKPEKPAAPKEKAAEDAEEAVAAKKGDLTPVYELEATYESVESGELKLKLEAYQGDLTLLKVAAAGDLVKKGDVLLSLDHAPIDKQIAALEHDLKVARATHEKSQADLELGARGETLALTQAETAFKDAATNLKSFEEVEGKHMVAAVELNVKFIEDALRDQTEELAQLEKMYKSEELTNATSEIVVRRAKRNIERTKLAIEMGQAELANVKTVKYPQQRQSLAHQIETTKVALETLKAAQNLSRVQREVEAAKAKTNLAQLEEQMAKLKRDLEIFNLRAPIDGRLYYGQFQHGAWTSEAVTPLLVAGEKLQAGQVLLTVCAPGIRARADLAEADYFDVTPGLDASVVPTASPEAKSEGTVRTKSMVGAMKGPAASYEVRIDFKQPPADLLPGMKGKATVRGKELKDVVLVPSTAVAAANGKCTLTVCSKDGKTSTREVTVGKSDGKMTQIKTGLEAGEKVSAPK